MTILEEVMQEEPDDQISAMQEQLSSLIGVVEAQSSQIATLSGSVKQLNGFVHVMDDQILGTDDVTGKQRQVFSQLSALSSGAERVRTTNASVATSGGVDDSRVLLLLERIANSMHGEDFKKQLEALTSAMATMTSTTASVAEQAVSRERSATKLIAAMHKAAASFHGAGKEELTAARREAAATIREFQNAAVTQITERADGANSKGERVLEAAERLTDLLERRRLWSAVAACFLALLPLAVIFLGVGASVASLTYGWDLVVNADVELWPRIGRGAGVVLATGGALWGLYALTRWVAGLVGDWKVKGTPNWPR